MPTKEKTQKVGELKTAIEKSPGFAFVRFHQLTVKDTESLRARLQQAGGFMKVVKKTLARLALSAANHEEMHQYLDGPIAIVTASEDMLEPLKVLAEFSREVKLDRFSMLCGFVNERVFDAAGIKVLATLPPREELEARLVYTIKAPLSNLVYALQGPVSSLVNTLTQVAAEKQKAA